MNLSDSIKNLKNKIEDINNKVTNLIELSNLANAKAKDNETKVGNVINTADNNLKNINEINNKIEALKPTQSLEYEGESKICNNTLASRTSDMLIKGKTYVNLGTGGLESAGEKENKISILSNNNKSEDDIDYKEYKKEILLPIEGGLKSLPNGVADTIEQRADGVYLVQRIKKMPLYGSVTLNYPQEQNSTNTVLIYFTNTHDAIPNTNNILCNAIKSCDAVYDIWNSSFDKEGVILNYKADLLIRINKSRLNTVDYDGIKKFINDNQLTVYYALKTPVETKLNINNLDLEVYKDVTYVATDNAIQPTLSFKVPSNIGGVIQSNAQNINKLYKLSDEVDNINKDNNIKTYTSLEQLGLTAPITVGDLFVGLPDNSLLRISCDNDSITGVPHKNGILIIDKCNASKFSIEYKISAGGSVNDNTLFIGQLKGVDGTGLTWSRVCTTSDTDIHVTTSDKTKWNEVDNKVDKSSITTIINSTSTATQVPSAKSVYDNAIKDKNIKTYTNVSQLGLTYPITVGEIFNAMPANSMAHLMADTGSKITDCPSANGILIIDKCYMSKFSIEFKISASGESATNTLYIGQLKGTDGSGLKWQRVCTTSVADTSLKKLTNSSDIKSDADITYMVKNGVCNVSINTLSSTKMSTGNITLTTGLPIPANTSCWYSLCTNSNTTNASLQNLLLRIDSSGNLIAYKGTDNINYFGSFTYPVKES